MSVWQRIERVVRVVTVRKPSPDQIRMVRAEFTPDVKRAFREHAKIARRIRFEIHHKIPISLGGLNNFENLQLCEKGIHGLFHQFIEEQNPKLACGQVLPVRLPLPSGLVICNRRFGL